MDKKKFFHFQSRHKHGYIPNLNLSREVYIHELKEAKLV